MLEQKKTDVGKLEGSGRVAMFFQALTDRRATFLAALLAVLPFLPTLGYGFLVEWDDGGFVTNNPHIALTRENLVHNLTTNLQGVYTPLTTFWLMIDNALFRGNPAGFHLVNLLLYAGTAGLFFLILRRLRLPPPAALILTLLWAWNPCKIETVAWIAERKGLASSFCAFWAMLLFMRGCRRNRVSYGAALLAFIAVFFKPWVLPLPGVMILYAWMLFPRDFRKILRLTGFPVLAGIAGAAAVYAMTFHELSGTRGIMLTDLAGLLRYTGAAFVPFSLNPLYPVAGFSEMLPELIRGGIVLAALWTAGFAAFGRTYGLRLSLAFSAALTGVALPVLSSGNFTNTNYADRYGFLISAVLWSWAGVAGMRFFRRFPRASVLTALVLATGYLLVGAVYSETFSDTTLLFARAVAEEDCPAKAIDGLALAGLNRNRPELVELGGALFLERAPRQTGPKRGNYETTGTLLVLLAPSMRETPGAKEKLGTLLEWIDSSRVYSPSAFLARAYALAVDARAMRGDRDGAVRLLKRQLDQKAGEAYSLAFASGLYGYLTGNKEMAVTGWKQALLAKPGDERAKRNLLAAEAMHGLE